MNRPAIWPDVRPVTLAGLLRVRAAERPDRVAFTFLADGEVEGARLTYAELDRQARAIGAALRQTMVPGERALLLYPPGLEFIAAFFGCLYAGVIAVPAYPPRPNDRSQSRLRSIVHDAEPRTALTTAAILAGVLGDPGERAGRAGDLAPELAVLRWLPTDSLPAFGADAFTAGGIDADDVADIAEPDPDAVAFLQYTSGSTAAPKGVMVTHANLLHNERMIGDAFGQDEDTVVAGWLPLYHDMGLIGNVLQPLHAGARCVLMSPVAFLQKPLRWLEAISQYRATTSGGPNFAYELCVRKVSAEERARLDLSSWKVAFNGAEPVREATLERFAEAFAASGFRREAFYPCYGLAEATLFVTGGELGRSPRVEAVDAAALERNEVLPAFAPDGPAVRRLVSNGRAWLGQRVVLADPETGIECPPGRVGEIWVAGPSVARGYWRNPEATERDFGAFLTGGHGPFLRTGDLGFASGGELFVTGRLKDLVIIRGRNHYPQDLELTAERSHPDLHAGGGAAFAVDVAGEERLVIVHEVARRRREPGTQAMPSGGPEGIAEAVRRAVAEEHEVQVHEVVLIRSGTLPKTSSGKVQRHAARAAYLAGGLLVVGRSAVASGMAPIEAQEAQAVELSRAALLALDPAERLPVAEAWLRARAAVLTGVPAAEIDPERPLTGFGLDSLAAVELKGAVEAALGAPVSLADLLQGADLRALAGQVLAGLEDGVLDAGEALPIRPLTPAERAADHPLSFGQKSLWFLDRLAPEGGAYNIAVAARTGSGLDPAALRRALSRLTDRHEAFRTLFPILESLGDEPAQRVMPEGGPARVAERVDLAEEDASAWSAERLSARMSEEAWRPFSLTNGPLLRLRIWDLAGGERALLLVVHHIVADFWTLAVVARELAALYRDETGGPAAELAPLPVSYVDFARWQAERLAGPHGERLWAYWRERLAGSLPDLDLPTDRPRPPLQTYRGEARAALLPAGLADGLRALASSRGATLYMALLAAFQAHLGRISRQDDLAVGSPTAGRGMPELAGVAGYFVNPVVLRADLSGEPSFSELLDRTRPTVLGALEHADYPFALLAERLRPVRDPARPPLFQTMFVLQRGRPHDDPGLAAFALGEEGARIDFAGLPLESLALAERRVGFDLSLRLAETPEGGLLASLEMSSDLFDGGTAERFLAQLRVFLEAAVADPGRSIADLPLLSPAELQTILADWNDTRTSRPQEDACLHELFTAQAERTPDHVAVAAEEESLTYRELLDRSASLARHLQRLGVGPETVVGLFAERSPELVTGILGVLRGGAAYLPLDPTYPRERLAYMMEDAGVDLLLTQRRLADAIPGRPGTVLFLDELDTVAGDDLLPVPVSPDNLAYVIYTSGSTGRPKGVAVPHRGVVNRLLEAHERFRITADDSILQRASIGFDASVWEFLSPLVAGGRVVLAKPGGHQDLGYMVRTLAEQRVSIVHFVPSILEVLVAEPGLERCAGSLRLMIAGGEALTGTLRDRFTALLPETVLANVYGPTEASIDLLWHLCDESECGAPAATVPIGKPIANTTAFVLDSGMRPVPVGVPGELYLGGVALVRGYLGRPDLTAERFVPHPFAAPETAGGRLYRTGDLARWLPGVPDGEVEFLGRVDQQVKIRGVRIELGEIEAVLTGHPGVREAAVTVQDDPAVGRRLVAHVVTGDGSSEARELRRFLGAGLPDAMVPAAYVFHESLPRTGSGKLDRRALVAFAPAAGGTGANAGIVEPRTPTERELAGIFRDLLGVEKVGLHDDFFELGGHSLLATRVLTRISRAFGVDLPVSALFQAPTVAALAERVQGAGWRSRIVPARVAPDTGAAGIPLSFAQLRIWFLHELDPDSAAYHIPGSLVLTGRLDTAALAWALSEIVRRHAALRTVFTAPAGEPVQLVLPDVLPEMPLGLPVLDLTTLPEGERGARQAEIARLEQEEARRPFDLATGPLLRARLLRLGEGEHRLIVVMHHIVSDGWSLGVFVRELGVLYEAAAEGRPAPLPPLPLQYPDYAVWQRRWLAGPALDDLLAWWRGRLSGDLPVLDLPSDRPRPPVRSGRGGLRPVSIPAEVVEGLRAVARHGGATLFMTLLAGFQALIHRYTAQRDVLVGSPVANRESVETEGLIGCFINTLVLRGRPAPDLPFSELLAQLREETLGAYDHQSLPFERLVEELAPERDRSRNPLFEVLLVLQNAPLPPLQLHGLRLELAEIDGGTTKFDLTLRLEEREAHGPGTGSGAGGLGGMLEYDADLFEAATADRMLGHFEVLLGGIVAGVAGMASPLEALPLLTAAERRQLLEWNDTGTVSAAPACLHTLVEERAARTPQAEALVGETGERWTFAELEAAANRIAHRLRGLGVGDEDRVGVCLRRTPEMVAAMLGILKAGGAYVPLDPAYPQERLAFMLEDSGAQVVLTEDGLTGRLALFGGHTVRLDAEREALAALPSTPPGPLPAGAPWPDNLAYLIYTSGSTGRPKGVAIEHRNAVALVRWAAGVFPPEDLSGALAATSICFDLSVFEIFLPLAANGRVILAENALALPAHPAAAEVTLVNTVPSAIAELVRSGGLPPSVRTVNLAGEPLKAALVEQIYAASESVQVVNLYGPSEDTTYSTWAPVPRGTTAVSIGVPIAGARVHLFAASWAEPAPVGVPGELCLAGEGLARGYFNRADLTAERFVPDPFGGAGERLYRTGDLARRRADGQIDFLGRIDHQVKVRGFRIEPGEIEAALAHHPGVREAAVVAQADPADAGGARLVAFAVLREPVPGGSGDVGEELRAWLGESLPDYMVPSAVVALDAMPLSPTGKVDRRALARIEPVWERERTGYAAPRNPTEELLAGIWAEVLERDRVGIHDDFFALGGHSLLGARLMARVRAVLEANLPLRDLFEAPTPATLAQRIAGYVSAEAEAWRNRVALTPVPPREAEAGVPLSFAQLRLWFLHELDPGSATYHIPGALALTGPLNAGALAWSLEQIARRHAALRTSFEGRPAGPVQRVREAVPLVLPQADLSGLPEALRRAECDRLERDEARRPFDLTTGPLMRMLLIRLAAEEHRLAVVLHHIVSDGWSLGVMVRELGALYDGAATGETVTLPALPVQYPDFAVWQRRWLAGPALDGLLGYWRERLSGELPLLDLPADRPRPPVRSGRGGLQPVRFPADLTEGLQAVSRRGGATLFMTLLAAFQTLLHRYTRQGDVLVGSPVANREVLETEGLIGCFINTLVLRGRPAPERRFSELLAEVRAETLGAYDHQSLPFERLVEELVPDRDRSRSPLFEVVLVLQNAPMPPLQLHDLRLALEEIDTGTTKFDLTLRLEERGAAGVLEGVLEYDADLFEPSTARRLAGHLEVLLRGIAAGSEQRLETLPLLTEAERRQLFDELNDTAPLAPITPACLHDMVRARTSRTPDEVAVVWGRESWTCAELEAAANRIAHRLRGLGVSAEDRVGVCLRRTPTLVAAMLGIVKSGGAYVPIDPTYPQDRMAFMLADSGAELVLTEESLVERLGSFHGRMIRLDCAEEIDALAGLPATDPGPLPWGGPLVDNLAYLIYTSGSTGRPKAVAIQHRSASILLHWCSHVFPPEDLAGVLASTSICFDMSVFEVFGTLALGGRMILADNALALPGLPAADEVTLINTVPSASAELVRTRSIPDSVRTINLGGEPLKPALVQKLYEGSRATRVINLYGPSEDTTYTTAEVVPRGASWVSIGEPVTGTRIYLFAASWAEPAPLGVPGELCIAGDGLTRGYLGRPDMTAARFVPDPFDRGGLGGRLYRTGDLVRRRLDGQLDYLGRFDHQVKVRGFRVELGEIEASLAHHPAVKEAVVMAREDLSVGTALVAYVVPRETWVLESWGLVAGEAGGTGSEANGPQDLDLGPTLRAFLKGRLPEYMVPSFFVELPELPLTPNGKVDRKALPLPGMPTGPAAGRVLPRTPVEELIAGLWVQVLGLPETSEIGVFDSFFDLGGHSLLATQLVSRLRETFEVEMPLARLFETPTVAGLARSVEEARSADSAAAAVPMRRAEREPGEALPLSFAQERLWFLEHLQPGTAYNLPLAVRLRGTLEPPRLAAVFEEIVRRHETLRTTFPEHDGDPVQVVGPPTPWVMPVVDLEGVPHAEARAMALAREEAVRSFDLTRGPLLRTCLARLRPDLHLLVLNMHHIVSDGWSMGVLLEEVAAHYGASLAGLPMPAASLPELPVQYADFAQWQREWLRGAELERQMSYWRRQLGGSSALLEMLTDRPRPQVQTSHGAWEPVEIPGALAARLSFGRRQGVTLFMVLLAAWQTLLHRHTGQVDLSVGSPIAGRNRGETERLIGFFVNTLVMRGDLSGNPTFEELLARARRVALAAYAHQDLPFEKLVEELRPVRDMSHQPLFQVMLTLQNAPLGKMELPGLSLTPLEVGSAGSKVDLTLVLTEAEDRIHGQLEYNTDLFDASTAARLAGHFRVLLEGIAESPRQPISVLPLLTGGERHQLLAEWTDTRPRPVGVCVHELIERQARRRPENVAAIDESGSWTYAELSRRSGAVAACLRRLGVGPEVRVGLYVERSLDMLAGMLGVLKAGGAYIPFDASYLGERLAFALADAGAPVLLTQERLVANLPELPGVRIVRIDHDAGPAGEDRIDHDAGPAGEDRIDYDAVPAGEGSYPVDGDNAAYVIYTSGSTGVPKGVTIPHKSLSAYACASSLVFRIEPEDRTLQFSSISFDASVEEIYGCLVRGASLVIQGEAVAGASELLRRCEEHGVTVMQLPTAYFHQIAAAMESENLPFPSRLRRLIVGGERLLPQRLVSWWKRAPERLHFINAYGPTEATVAATMCLFPGVVPLDERLTEVPLGYPLPYVKTYVLDRQMQPVPIGVAGELLLGGRGLARGYLGRPDLTADKFIPNAFADDLSEAEGNRLYRTGDLVRRLPNGMLEFLGRLDDQVKVRGFRIELGEIEAVLGRHPGVREAVVMARDSGTGDKRLVGYVSPQSEPAPTVAELRDFLEEQLPAYMVPSILLILPVLPVNVHGKVDRKALPDPRTLQAGLAGTAAEYVAPANELEERIAEVWRELFGLERVGVHDNFFDSGGNSLLIVKLHSRLQKVLDREFPLVDIFQHPTVSALAASLGGGESAKPSVAENAKARTDTRRESMRQLQQRRGQRRTQRNER